MEERPGMMDRSSIFNFNKRLDVLSREYQIAIETQSYIGEKLAECVRTEGVNQYVNCRDLSLRYKELCEDRFHGMIFPPEVDAEKISRVRIMGLSKQNEK